MGGDANTSAVIDNKSGLRALLNHAILEVYRTKAKDQRFLRDITVRNTVAVAGGVGAVPSTVLREFLDQGDFTDDDNSLVTYFNYAADFNSGANYNQLGYCYVQGDNFVYTAPAPSVSYTGNLFVTAPSVPAISSTMTFPSEATIDDVVLLLARAIRGEIKFETVDV
jgi:hypothetical protein